MNKKETKLKVEIYGTSYILKGESDMEYMKELAAYVDRKMHEIQAETGLISPVKIAILTSLNIADELYKADPKNKDFTAPYDNMAKKAIDLIDKIEKELL